MFMNKTPVSKSAKDGHGHKYKRKYRDLKKYIVSLVYVSIDFLCFLIFTVDYSVYILFMFAGKCCFMRSNHVFTRQNTLHKGGDQLSNEKDAAN